MFERKAYTILMGKYRCNNPISSFYNFTKSPNDLISDFLALRENYNRYSTVVFSYGGLSKKKPVTPRCSEIRRCAHELKESKTSVTEENISLLLSLE